MDTLALHVRGPLRRPDLPGLFARVCAQMAAARPRVVLCDVSECEADLVALAALTRLQLAARRRGCEVRLAGATGEMLALVAFLGLAEALPARHGPAHERDDHRVEVQREVSQRSRRRTP